jgi:uncharacterized RDD family membrane protein YckC
LIRSSRFIMNSWRRPVADGQYAPSPIHSLHYAGFWLRFVAAIIDLIILGIALSVFVSFLAVARKIPLAFTDLHIDEPPSQVVAAFGVSLLFAILCFFVISSWLYFALLESSSWQGTVGKNILGLYVAGTQGNRVTFGRASLRFAGGRLLAHLPYVGLIYFAVDCIFAGLTSRKQALHDSMAGCLVLRKQVGISFRE